MKHCDITYHLELIEERVLPEGTYRLLRLRESDLLKFAVEIVDRSGHDIALLDGKERACREFFDKISVGALSSIQLCEAAEDFSLECALEIF